MTVQDAVELDPATIAGRVDAGYRYLDRRLPGWRNWIRLKDLKLISAQRCVLGQLQFHPDLLHGTGYDAYDRVTKALGLSDEQARGYGFLASGDGGPRGAAEYAELEAEWRRRLQGYRIPLRHRFARFWGKHV